MDYNFGLPFCKLMKRFLYFVFLILEKAIADSDDSSSVDNEINSCEMEDEENVSFLNKVDQQVEVSVYCQGQVHGTMWQISIIYYSCTLLSTTSQKLCFFVMDLPKHPTTTTTLKLYEN